MWPPYICPHLLQLTVPSQKARPMAAGGAKQTREGRAGQTVHSMLDGDVGGGDVVLYRRHLVP